MRVWTSDVAWWPVSDNNEIRVVASDAAWCLVSHKK